MENKITEEQHERLCAFLFDELAGEERAAFEAEMAADSALRAEADKLKASMALVREFAPAAPAELSSASREALTEAAAAAGAPPAAPAPIVKLAWYRHPGLQVAAAAAIAIVSFRALDQRIGFTSGHGLRPDSSRDVAALDERAEGRRESGAWTGAEATQGFAGIGYSDGSGAAADDAGLFDALGYVGGDVSVSSVSSTSAVGGGNYRGPGDSAPSSGPGSTVFHITPSTPQTVPTGGYNAGSPGASLKDTKRSAGVATGGVFAPPKEQAPVSLGLELSPAVKNRLRSMGYGGGGGGVGDAIPGSKSPSGPAPTGSGEFFLGSGEPAASPPADRAGYSAGFSVEMTEDALGELEKLGYLADDFNDSLALPAIVDEVAEKKRKQAATERYYENLIQRFQRHPNEKPSMMYFRFWGDNGFEFPQHDALSTFAAEADTASYTLARKTIQNGYLPQRAQIRTEEFVNYFTPDVAPPQEGAVFNVQHELAPSIFGPGGEGATDRWTLRVGVRGKVVATEERAPLALTFVIDVSGSMKEGGRLELVKHALRLLAGELKGGDSMAVITFNTEAHRIFEMQSVGNKSALEQALYQMQPDGGTNAEAGLRNGYEEAVLGYVEGAVNRVVFLSDGVGNIGETNENKLLEDVKRARDKGIYLNTIGVGMGNHNDRFLEQLADGGDGLCNYIDGPDEAERALVTNFTSAFQPIARDVKLQVEFDPKQVVAYRLLGYENRAIADADFRNDKVDAGELGSGHQVVALYELVLGDVDESGETPLATTRVRYKQPYLELAKAAEGKSAEGSEATTAGQDQDVATEIEATCTWSAAKGSMDEASLGFQKSALAAEFAEMLRRSTHAKDDSVSLLRYKLDELAKQSGDPEVTELAALVQLAQPQLEAALKDTNPAQQSIEDLAQFEWNCARSDYLGMPIDQAQTDTRRLELRAVLKVAVER